MNAQMPRALLIACVVLAACWGPAPAKGAKAERGYQSAPPVIAAIERYQIARGHYPTTLDSLVPEFLPSAAALRSPAQHGYPWEYARDSAGYTLTFRYTGPGMNYCRYTRRDPHWHCGGYY